MQTIAINDVEKLAQMLMDDKGKSVVLCESEDEAWVVTRVLGSKGARFETRRYKGEESLLSLREFEEDPEVKVLFAFRSPAETMPQTRAHDKLYRLEFKKKNFSLDTGSGAFKFKRDSLWSLTKRDAILELRKMEGSRRAMYVFSATVFAESFSVQKPKSHATAFLSESQLQELGVFLQNPNEEGVQFFGGSLAGGNPVSRAFRAKSLRLENGWDVVEVRLCFGPGETAPNGMIKMTSVAEEAIVHVPLGKAKELLEKIQYEV